MENSDNTESTEEKQAESKEEESEREENTKSKEKKQAESERKENRPNQKTSSFKANTYSQSRNIVNAFADPGLILALLGLLAFIYEYLGNNTLSLIVGIIFLFYSSIFIFKGQGFGITVAFCVWYIGYGGVITLPTSSNPLNILYTLAYTFGIPLLIGMVAHGLFGWLKKTETFTEGATNELVGLIPVLFFFLDLGLIPLLTTTYNLPLTSPIKELILFAPWWTFLGLFTIKKDNWIITFCKVLGVAYIALLLIGIPTTTYAEYKLTAPGTSQLLKAKAVVQQQLPKTENLAWSNLMCTFEDPSHFQSCVSQRQENSEIAYTCEKINGLTKGTSTYDDCIKKEQDKKKKAITIGGTTDPTIKQATEIKLETEDETKTLTAILRNNSDTSALKYPIQLKIKNPHKEKITVSITCEIEKGTEKIKGTISPKEAETGTGSFQDMTDTEINKNIVCIPNAVTLSEGTYTITYTANILNLVSTSRLTRAFIGQKNSTEKTELIKKIKSTYFASNNAISLSPNDPVRINFALGEPPSDPIIESEDNVLLRVDAEKTGEGELTKIISYSVDLNPIPTSNCFQGGETDYSSSKNTFISQTYPLASCFVNLPNELKMPTEEYVIKEFTAKLTYNYKIQKKMGVTVTIA